MGKQAGRQRPARSTGISRVDLGVDDAVRAHSECPHGDHSQHHPAEARPILAYLHRHKGGYDGERQSEYAVLELDGLGEDHNASPRPKDHPVTAHSRTAAAHPSPDCRACAGVRLFTNIFSSAGNVSSGDGPSE